MKLFGGGRYLHVGRRYRVFFEVKDGSYSGQRIARIKFGERGYSWVEVYTINNNELREVCGWITGTDTDDVVENRLDGLTDSRKPDPR